MTTIVNVQEAKTRLSELLRRVEAGEEIEIARSGHVIARLLAVDPPVRNFDFPLLAGLPPIDVAVFDDVNEEDLKDWEDINEDDPLFGAIS